MSLVPSPSAARGDLTLQPPFFTSSLFVNPFRVDVEQLIDLFIQEYTDDVTHPFTLFKRIWQEQGWTYTHLKVFDARTRHSYLTVVCRLFIERIAEQVEPMRRLVALFGLYTFYFTQPSSSRISLYSIRHIDIATDQYGLLLELPKTVSLKLAPYASQILSAFVDVDAFYVLPTSRVEPYNPRTLPREVYVEDEEEAIEDHALTLPSELGLDSQVPGLNSDTRTATKLAKKKGRPSRRDIAKRKKDAIVGLDRWLERTESIGRLASGGGTGPSRNRGHAILSHAPTVSRTNYRAEKARVLNNLLGNEDRGGLETLERANMAVLNRLRKIDAMAAEKGMEVGGEGGELTGLGRVERAARELRERDQGGILGLLEGAGGRG
ncbi:hypothetical protein B0F90DRAFT_1676222 [Multifurca ochricompacta]|uniref:Uncharacterized protein n=1 Tax=Multifurca ochricompacta TaxID=376703 RepID=A0AAD4MDM9_9AGAM|nr:hypothetical protein B0F90DRAFT_1676222 [Multifurca ochricompacta]